MDKNSCCLVLSHLLHSSIYVHLDLPIRWHRRSYPPSQLLLPLLLKLWLEEYFVLSNCVLLVGMAVSLTSCFLFSAICIFRHLSKRWSPILNTSTWAFPSDTGVGHASIIETSLSQEISSSLNWDLLHCNQHQSQINQLKVELFLTKMKINANMER